MRGLPGSFILNCRKNREEDMVRAYAATAAKAPLAPFEYQPGPLAPEQVDLDVVSCGVCHSDMSMADNSWGFTTYPFVPGHEVIGKVAAVGQAVKHLKPGQTVGLGWFAHSCGTCKSCVAGDRNLCATPEQTIIGRHGGFATRVRAGADWVLPLPPGLDPASAGPLFCAGITVFNPILQFAVRPTDRVGVIGIGGLGHLALQFLNKWGCEVTAFTSSSGKRDEALKMGAHRTVSSRDAEGMKALRGSFDFIISTVDANLEWPAILETLGPRGRLHVVGAVPDPIPVSAMTLLMAQRSVSGSPSGSPATLATMLDFCARHKIAPIVERFPLSKANEALAHLRAGKARYRIVLDNDLK
jgi:uncharacterized zinc-type alcohol dehydrogenase-like protein